MINLNIRPYLDVILSENQVDWLLSKLFEIQIESLSRISKLTIFKETFFSDLLIFSHYLTAVTELQKEGLIKKTMADLTRQTLWKIFNNLDQYTTNEATNHKEISEHEIEEQFKFIKFFHLAVLATFKKIQLLGRKKRQKLLFLFTDNEKRKVAIKIRSDLMEKEKRIKESDLESFIPYQGYIAPEFAVANFGMYDKTMNDYVTSTLIIPNYVTYHLGKNRTLYLQLTDRGWKYVQELLESDEDFKTFLRIAEQLKPYFDNMTGNELITFLKEYVVLDWEKNRFWSQLK